jgi:hypothetical protein
MIENIPDPAGITNTVTPIVTKIVNALIPYIVTGIVSLVGVIMATVGNMLHRTKSNAAVLTAIQAVTPPAQASNPIIGMVKAAPVDTAPTQTADSAHNSV